MRDEVTLDEVARRSGVSRATASRALNNREGVREDVRERVRIIADALGYRPNRAAQRLASGRASVIGLVIGEADPKIRPYVAALTQGVAVAADKHGQALVLVLRADDPNETVRETVGNGLVDGLIVNTVAKDSPWAERLLEDDLPAVFLGDAGGQFNGPFIDVENKNSSAAMVGHLLDSAGPRVATITGPLYRADAADRLEGYRLAHTQRSIPIDESLILPGNFLRPSGYEQARHVFERGADAVFCANDEMARGVYRYAVERGVIIPEEFSLAGFDGTATDAFDYPSLTSVVQPLIEMANLAVEMLIRQIGGEPIEQSRSVEPWLFYGDTSKPPVVSS